MPIDPFFGFYAANAGPVQKPPGTPATTTTLNTSVNSNSPSNVGSTNRQQMEAAGKPTAGGYSLLEGNPLRVNSTPQNPIVTQAQAQANNTSYVTSAKENVPASKPTAYTPIPNASTPTSYEQKLAAVETTVGNANPLLNLAGTYYPAIKQASVERTYNSILFDQNQAGRSLAQTGQANYEKVGKYGLPEFYQVTPKYSLVQQSNLYTPAPADNLAGNYNKSNYVSKANDLITSGNVITELHNKEITAQNEAILKENKVGLNLASGFDTMVAPYDSRVNSLFDRGFAIQFAEGAVENVLGTVDLAAEATINMNPGRAANKLIQGYEALPGQAISNPARTAGAIVSGALIAKGFSPVIKGIGDYSATAAEKVYSPNALGFGTQEYYKYIAKPLAIIKPENIEPPKITDVTKISLPTGIRYERSAVLSAGEDEFIKSERSADFIKTEEFVIKNPIIEVQPFAQGRFTSTIEQFSLQETAKGNLGGSLETISKVGSATVEQGKMPEIPQPANDIFGLRSMASPTDLSPQSVIFKDVETPVNKPFQNVYSGELIPTNQLAKIAPEPENVNIGAAYGSLGIKLFPEAAERILNEPLSLRKGGVPGLEVSKGLKSAGVLIKENTVIDISPKIEDVAPRAYSKGYFSREENFGGFSKDTLKLSPYFGKFKAQPSLGEFTGKLPGSSMFGKFKLAIEGQSGVTPSMMRAFGSGKPFKPFSFKDTGSEASGSSVDVGAGGGTKAQMLVKQIMKRNQRAIPKTDIQARTIVRAASVTTVEDIAKLRDAYIKGRTNVRTSGYSPYEIYSYPKEANKFIPMGITIPQEKPISERKDLVNPFTNIRPINSIGSLGSQVSITNTFDKQITDQITKQATTQTEKQITREITKQLTPQTTSQIGLDRITQIQRTIDIQIPKQLTQQQPKPQNGNNPDLWNVQNEFKEIKKKNLLGNIGAKYRVKVRRFGEFKTVRTDLTRPQAIKAGIDITASTLAATFKIEKQNYGIETLGGAPAVLNQRYYQKLPNMYIQKSKFRLSSPGEKLGIRMAKGFSKLKRGLNVRTLL